MVGNELGVSSRDVGTLCSRAKIGGEQNSAFSNVDGVLLYGAQPFWNIYSNGIPAEWYADQDDRLAGLFPKVKLRLGDPTGLAVYSYRLGGFRNYEHDAIPPAIENKTYYIPGSGGIDTTVRCTVGTYNWRMVKNAEQVMKVCLLFQETYDGNVLKMPSVDYSQIQPGGVDLVLATQSYIDSGRYSLYLGICNSNDEVVGVLPITGEIVVKKDFISKTVIYTNIDSYVRVDDQYTALDLVYYKIKGRLTVINTLNKSYTMKRLRLNFINSNGNNLSISMPLFLDHTNEPRVLSYYEDAVGTTKYIDIDMTGYESYLNEYNGNYDIVLEYT